MRISTTVGILCLFIFCGCGEEADSPSNNDIAEPEECQLAGEGSFGMTSLDMKFEPAGVYGVVGASHEFDATVVEAPFADPSGHLVPEPRYLVLRDEHGNDCRFKFAGNIDKEKQPDRLQLGKDYHFVVWTCEDIGGQYIYGIKILDGKLLLYLAATYIEYLPPAFAEEPFGSRMEGDAFKGTELEGLSYEQLDQSPCHPKTEEVKMRGTTLVTNLPVIFRYGNQVLTLYHSQEATLTTPDGNFLIHILSSIRDEPQDYVDGTSGYSFYVKRL